jgi:hypothetical protein
MRQPDCFTLHAVRWVAAAALAFACTFAAAQPRYGLSPEVSAVFNRWVLATCIGDEERKLVEELRRFPEPLALAFRKAIQDGPPPGELRAARAAAEARFAAREKFPIQEFRIEGVSERDLAVFGRVSRQSYVDDQVRRFTNGYRSNAVAGLGLVGGPGARDMLTRIGNDKNDPLALAAREAIRSSER